MMFQITNRTKKTVTALLVAGLVGGGTAGGVIAATGNSPPQASAQAAPAHSTVRSTVPASVTRAETAAEDVIGFLDTGKVAQSKAEARIMKQLAHGRAAQDLRQAGLPAAKVRAFQQRVDRTARLSAGGAPALQVSLAANSVSQLMPEFYARFSDPVPAAVLKLDYLDREVQLRSKAAQHSALRGTVTELTATWQQLRPQVVAAGGLKVARAYDAHVSALQGKATATVVQKQAVNGLDIVDQMEKVFTG